MFTFLLFWLNLYTVLSVRIIIPNAHSMNETKQAYLKRRDDLLVQESSTRTGGRIVLSKAELRANEILMTAKFEEIESARIGETPFPPSIHFFKAKPLIRRSHVFRIIKAMPKGAVLHIHDSAMVDARWLISRVTYLDNCYVCFNKNQVEQFHFFETPPRPKPDCRWQNVSLLRSKAPSFVQFDEWLFKNLTLLVNDPATAYPDQATVWKRFQGLFNAVTGLIFYAPAFKEYYKRALQVFYNDNVLYLEVRALLKNVYELNGTVHNKQWVLKTYQQISKEFQHTHQDFVGSKIIFTTSRKISPTDLSTAIKEVLTMRKEFPDFVAGFDLVGQEDGGHPLLYYIDQLLMPSQMNPPVKLPYFFHAGETDWNMEAVDKNLLDAVLLNTSRIGHGYALDKHHAVLKIIKEHKIAVELNPISNQVLGLVSDLRNHPAAHFLAVNIPVVVSCDDPAMWDAEGVSYDWYELFMGIAGADDDLKLLKQLAINSIRYSAMRKDEKLKALTIFKVNWEVFIEHVVSNLGPANHLKLIT